MEENRPAGTLDEILSQLKQIKGILASLRPTREAAEKKEAETAPKRPEFPEDWKGKPVVEFSRKQNGDTQCRLRIPADYAHLTGIQTNRLICYGGIKWKPVVDGGIKLNIRKSTREIVAETAGTAFDLPDGAFKDGTTRYYYSVLYSAEDRAFYRIGEPIKS